MQKTPFEIFNITPGYEIDLEKIENEYYRASRDLHPDRSARADKATLIQNQAKSAELNHAFFALKSPETRLETLLKLHGQLKEDSQTESKNQIPLELAEEFFEIQDAPLPEVERFKEKLALLINTKNSQIESLAKTADWSDFSSPQTKEIIVKILSIRKERAYISSMVNNL